MRGREKNLLDEIERGALDSRTSLADILRKCIMLGGRAGSVELRTWASRELNGYGPDDELPDWRIASAQIKIDFHNLRYNVTGQAISPLELPDFAQDRVKEEYPFRMGVSAMEDLVKSGDTVKFGIPGGQDLVMFINHQNEGSYQNIRSIYWTVSTIAVNAILDRIRTTLVELVAEMRAGMPSDAAVPSPELANQAVWIAVHGKGSRITFNNAQSSSGSITQTTPPEEDSPGRKRWVLIGGFIVGAATVIGVVYQIFWSG